MSSGRTLFDLQEFRVDSAEQRLRLEALLEEVVVPGLHESSATPVGVFERGDDPLILFLLAPFDSFEHRMRFADDLARNPKLDPRRGSKVLPAYRERIGSLLRAFEGMGAVERPARGEGRVFQLRVYEHPNVFAGARKIEMFRGGELDIFRKVGLNHVFFAEAVSGARLPNLTYMLGFEDDAAQLAAWRAFRDDPDWQQLRSVPEYADALLIRDITNLSLRPLPFSDI